MATNRIDSHTLKAEARRLGFAHVGLAPAEPVDEAFMAAYEDWICRGWHGEMHYLENHLDLRRDPRLLLPEAKAIVSLAMSYNLASLPTQPGLAWYAQGKDYHDVVRERASQLVEACMDATCRARICVDTAPVMEKYWAWRCGLGWIGRNRQFIVPHEGSAFFLAEVILTQESDHYDEPLTASALTSPCGRCHRCLDACPTQALTVDGLDARRCLSYLTIEHRGALPEEVKPHLTECFYGCDRCLKACPHLSQQPTSVIEAFRPSPELLGMTPEDWRGLTLEQYRSLFRGSAVKRAKYEGLRRNIQSNES